MMKFSYTGRKEHLRIDTTGWYMIECWGASGGGRYKENTGHGAYSRSVCYLQEGDTLTYIVGGQGAWSGRVGSGGGGTFVQLQTNTTLLCAAGGGGGAQQNVNHDPQSEYLITKYTHGQSGTKGGHYGGATVNNRPDGYSGTDYGRTEGTHYRGDTDGIVCGCGAGYRGDGATKVEDYSHRHANYYGAKSFLNGGVGGYMGTHGPSGSVQGGFGGGGGASHTSINFSCYYSSDIYYINQSAGGGGGYTGGDSTRYDVECGAGGGGSYFTGPNSFAKAGYEEMLKAGDDCGYGDYTVGNYGDGYIRITLCSNLYVLEKDGKYYIPTREFFDESRSRFNPVTRDFIIDPDNRPKIPRQISELNQEFTIRGVTYKPSKIIDFSKHKVVYFCNDRTFSHADIKYTPSKKALLKGTFKVKEFFNIAARQLENCNFEYETGGVLNTIFEKDNQNQNLATEYIGEGYKQTELSKIQTDGISSNSIDNYRVDFDTRLYISPLAPDSILKRITLHGKRNSVYKKMTDSDLMIYNDFDNIYIKFYSQHNEVIINKITRTSQQELINSLTKIVRFPIKICDVDKVSEYASTLNKGEEQLIITRSCGLYLTDGRGGYRQFETINSGITRDDVEQIIADLQSTTDADIEKINQLINDIQESLEQSQNEIENLNTSLDNFHIEISNLKETVNKVEEKAEHDNREVLDNFSESPTGKLLYKNKLIEGTGSGITSSLPYFGKITQRRK